MSQSALSNSFEYLCYGSTSTAIINIFTLTVRGSANTIRGVIILVWPREVNIGERQVISSIDYENGACVYVSCLFRPLLPLMDQRLLYKHRS